MKTACLSTFPAREWAALSAIEAKRSMRFNTLPLLVENKGSEDYTRVTIDTENYRQKREMTLIRLAERLARKAIKSGRA